MLNCTCCVIAIIVKPILSAKKYVYLESFRALTVVLLFSPLGGVVCRKTVIKKTFRHLTEEIFENLNEYVNEYINENINEYVIV